MKNFTLYIMGQKGLAVLRAVADRFGTGLITEVVTARDRGVVKDYYVEIMKECEGNNIRCLTRKKHAGHSDWALAVGWRWMLSSHNLIVMHDSLLPKYRGFAPLPNMLINHEPYIGVTSLLAGDGSYDTGPVIEQFKVPVSYPIKIQAAIDIVSEMYEQAAVSAVDKVLSGSLSAQEQCGQATYSLWRDDEDYIIDWSQDAQHIAQHVDAVGHPYMGALTKMRAGGKEDMVRVLDVSVAEDVFIAGDRKYAVGKVIFMTDGKPTVVCGTGTITIDNMVYDGTDNPARPKSFRTRFGE